MNDGGMIGNPAAQSVGQARRQLMVIFNPAAGRRRRRGMAQAMRLLEGRADISQ